MRSGFAISIGNKREIGFFTQKQDLDLYTKVENRVRLLTFGRKRVYKVRRDIKVKCRNLRLDKS